MAKVFLIHPTFSHGPLGRAQQAGCEWPLDSMLASLDRHSVTAEAISLHHSLHPFCPPAPQQPPWSPSAACSWPEPSLDCQQLHRWGTQPRCMSCSASICRCCPVGDMKAAAHTLWRPHSLTSACRPTSCGSPAAGGAWPPSSARRPTAAHWRLPAGEYGGCSACAAAWLPFGPHVAVTQLPLAECLAPTHLCHSCGHCMCQQRPALSTTL